MNTLQTIALALLAQAIGVACGTDLDGFCELARCPHGCDENAQRCRPDPAPPEIQLEASRARLRLAGPAWHVIFTRDEIFVLEAESEAPPARVGALRAEQQRWIADWLFQFSEQGLAASLGGGEGAN